MGLETVSVIVRDPGMPGTARSESFTVQLTVAVTWAVVPIGAEKPLVSTWTLVVAHLMSWSSRLPMAAVRASAEAWLDVRAMDAALAASLAAVSTPWRPSATGPPPRSWR